MAYRDEVLADSPLVYYRLQEGAITTDSSGNGRTLSQTGSGMVTGDSLISSDPSNKALTFNNDPAADHLDLVDSTPIAFTGTTAFTLECWIRDPAADATFRRAISWSDDTTASTNTYGILYRLGAGNGIGAWRRVAGTDNISWYAPADFVATFHVVMTYDGVNIHLFVNGVERDSDASGSQGAYAGNFQIGCGQSGGSGSRATTDEVAVYSGVLSNARIQAHYNEGILALSDNPPMGVSGRGAGW